MTTWEGFFLSKGNNLTNLVDDELVMLHTKYEGFSQVVSDKKIYRCFSLFKPMLNITLGHRPFFDPWHNLNNFVEVH